MNFISYSIQADRFSVAGNRWGSRNMNKGIENLIFSTRNKVSENNAEKYGLPDMYRYFQENKVVGSKQSSLQCVHHRP
jgi:hypothetical protein